MLNLGALPLEVRGGFAEHSARIRFISELYSSRFKTTFSFVSVLRGVMLRLEAQNGLYAPNSVSTTLKTTAISCLSGHSLEPGQSSR